jgi:hypothetical protein
MILKTQKCHQTVIKPEKSFNHFALILLELI